MLVSVTEASEDIDTGGRKSEKSIVQQSELVCRPSVPTGDCMLTSFR
jgi:hypothetical protein